MKLIHGFILAATLLTGSYATSEAAKDHDKHEEHKEQPKLSWLQRLRIGTTMHDGKFVSPQFVSSLDVYPAYSYVLRNPLHPEHKDDHNQLETRSHIDHEDPHTHEEQVILRFFGHQFPHSKEHPEGHNLESCTGLHAETEENLYAVRRLLDSVYNLVDGLEWFVVSPSHHFRMLTRFCRSNDPKHLSHAHEHHHLLLDDEPWRTTCDDMQHSTVMELKMIETLLRGARKLVSDLEHHWEQPHHFAPELLEPEHHGDPHYAEYYHGDPHHAEYHHGDPHHAEYHHGDFHHGDFHYEDIHHGDHHEDSHHGDPHHDAHHYGHDSAHHGDYFHHSDSHSNGHDSYFKKDHH
jgi:hypothetical protein